MKSENVAKTERLRDVDEYPYGANSPTQRIAYKCFCGKGKIEEEHVWGFNDHIVTLSCKECEKKYRSYMDFSYEGWIRYEK